MVNGVDLIFVSGNNDFGFLVTLYKAGNGYECAVSANYLDIYSTDGHDMQISDLYGDGETYSAGLIMLNLSRSGNGNHENGVISTYDMRAYGISGGAPLTISIYQTYTWGGTWNEFLGYINDLY